jgi:hypothetical protein
MATMGTWWNTKLNQGYSGPKPEGDEWVAADPSTGKPMSSSSLEGTLPPENKTLPAENVDNLTAFRSVLQSVSQRYNQNAKASGMGGVMKTLGAENQPMSGSSLADIVKFVKSGTGGISDIYKSTTDLLDKQEKAANDQLQMMISTGAIADADDATLQRLANSANVPLSYLEQVRTVKKKSTGGEESIDDASYYADMVLSGQLDLTSVPTTKGVRLETGKILDELYANPIVNATIVWREKKNNYQKNSLSGQFTKLGTRDDLIKKIKAQFPEYDESEIKQIVYSIINTTAYDEW